MELRTIDDRDVVQREVGTVGDLHHARVFLCQRRRSLGLDCEVPPRRDAGTIAGCQRCPATAVQYPVSDDATIGRTTCGDPCRAVAARG